MLKHQVNLTSLETEYLPEAELPPQARYFQYQKIVHQGEVPSRQVIQDHIRKIGKDL